MRLEKGIFSVMFFLFYFSATLYGENGRLKVGYKIPDLTFKKVVNYKSGTLKLSELKGKKVILDLWHKWCSACIGAFPSVEKLQREFDEEVVILAISYDSESDFIRLKERSRILQESKLPFVLEDSSLYKSFLPPAFPFYVWVDEKGVIVATSTGSSLTRENIMKFINGTSINKDFSLVKEKGYSFSEREALIDQHKYYISFEKEHKTDFFPEVRSLGSRNSERSLQLLDQTLSQLYVFAYQLGSEDRLITYDPELSYIIKPANEAKLDEWRAGSTYSLYLRLMPKGEGLGQLRLRIIRRELEKKLGIRARNIQVERRVWILRNIADRISMCSRNTNEISIAERTADGIYIRNGTMKEFIEKLSYWVNFNSISANPVLNDTNIECNIDVDIHFDSLRISSINETLGRYGLRLQAETKVFDMLLLEKIR